MLDKDDINARLKKSLTGSVPKLKCIITGLERNTSMDYLKTKESKFGSIDNFINNYISSGALKLLKNNISVLEIKNTLNPNNSFTPSDTQINEARKYYGV